MKHSLRWIALVLALLMMLPAAQAASPTAKPGSTKVEGASPAVTVYLKSIGLRDAADLTLDGTYSAVTEAGTELLFKRGAAVSIRLREGKLWLFTDQVNLSLGDKVIFTRNASDKLTEDGIRFTAGGNLFPGDLKLDIKDGAIRPILTVPVEEYLLGVVPYEMSNSFPLEALKAQAVCARTYALAHVNATSDYDLVDNTNDQVFRGIYWGNGNAIKAVRETAGIVGSYKGKLATCYYAASNGGQTELPSTVWSARGKLPYYAVTEDPYDLENPESVVKTAHLKKNGNDLPDDFVQLLREQVISQISTLGYDASPENFRITGLDKIILGGHTLGDKNTYVTQMTVTFRWAGKKWIQPSSEGEEDFDLAQLLGLASPEPTLQPGATPEPRLSAFMEAPDAATVTVPLFPNVAQCFSLLISGTSYERITVEETGSEFLLRGRRFGHGVGMSQRGAQWMAGHYNMTFVQILNFYYPHMDLYMVPSGEAKAPTPRPQLAATPGPSASPTPRPTLMPVSSIADGSYLASIEGIDDDSSLNLRNEPQSGADILMRMYKHQQLEVIELSEDGIWAHVRTDSIEGWCMVTYLQRIDATPMPAMLSPI